MGLFSNLFGLSKSIRLNEKEALTGFELKTVLVSCIYAEQQGAYINCYTTGIKAEKRKMILETWWGIYTKEEAADKLFYLLNEGYAKLFPVVYDAFIDDAGKYADILEKNVAAEELEKAADMFRNIRVNYNQLLQDKVVETKADIKKYGIAGWDYGRGSFIARLCYEEGYMDLKELKNYLSDNLKALKLHCNNWECFTKSYIIGRAMWNGDHNTGMVVIANDLLNNPKSPLYNTVL